MRAAITLGGDQLRVDSLVDRARRGGPYELATDARERIAAGRAVVERLLAAETPVYGVNTGVGSQKDHPVPPGEIADYNRRLIRAHGTRVPGPALPPEAVRATMLVLVQQFSSGAAGVSSELVDLVVRHAGSPELPLIDAAGTVGASDLVPQSQLADWLLSRPDAGGLPRAKDALSLINCNAVSLAAGAFGIDRLHQTVRLFDVAAACTLEGFRANLDAISEPVNTVHARSHQAAAAVRLRELLGGSALWRHGEARLLQDPLSFRNITQIHGALHELADRLTSVWNDELNSVGINPIVHDGERAFSSHGNMDTTRMTLALDGCRQALAKTADIAGERIQKVQWPNFSGLPIGLAEEGSPIGGVQFLNLGHIASSFITSVKIWAQPHLLHSVGQLADGVEDTASHALHAVADLERQLDACRTIAAIETSIAVWAIARRGVRPDDLGTAPREMYDLIRPLLPIGREGDTGFDLNEIVRVVAESELP